MVVSRARVVIACALLLVAAPARAHSASDAFLTLAVAQGPTTGTVIEGQWDIALRDLHFVHRLDDDGDGNLTWGEVRAHEADITRIAYARLRIAGDGASCPIEPTRLLVSTRADGAYAALLFRAVCDKHPQELAVEYKLFFDVDPTHRGIAVIRTATGTATALFAPDNARVALTLAGPVRRIGRPSHDH